MRSPPISVRRVTMPGWSLTTRPAMAASRPSGCARIPPRTPAPPASATALAPRHDGDAVGADGAPHPHHVAGAPRRDRERAALGQKPPPGGGNEDLVALAAVAPLRIAGAQRPLRPPAGPAHRVDPPPQVV